MKRVPLVTAAILLMAGVATASARTRVTLTVPQATAGTATPVHFTASGVTRHQTLVLQRQVGTGKVWKTVARPSRAGHTVNVPPLGLGLYRIRLAVLAAPHNHVVAQQARTLDVFGTVPFTSLFPNGDGGGNDDGPGTLQTSTTTFPYAFSYGNVGSFTIGTGNPCRSATIQFLLADNDPSDAAATVTATIVQQSADAVSATVPVNAVGTVSSPLVAGQTWGLNVTDPVFETVGIDGSASCDALHMPGTT